MLPTFANNARKVEPLQPRWLSWSLKIHRDFCTIRSGFSCHPTFSSPVEPNKHRHWVNRYYSPPCIFAKASQDVWGAIWQLNLSHITSITSCTKLPTHQTANETGQTWKPCLVPSHVFETTLATHATTRVFQVRSLTRCFWWLQNTSMAASKQEGMNPQIIARLEASENLHLVSFFNIFNSIE